jgi:hypothetical protein
MWRRWVGLGLGLVLAGCGGAARITATPARVTAVAASCAALSPAEQFAAAPLVFVGRMLPGPTTMRGHRRVLGSPAGVRVERYLKGHGPSTVKVRTAVTIASDAIGIAEDGIEPQPGERWKIYATSRGQPFDTSICAGSRAVGASTPLIGYVRAAVLHLARPPGARVLISATDGGAVAVTPAR